MKRLERLGSAAFATVAISLVFHLLAMSYDNMIDSVCLDCNYTNPLGTWKTSLLKRCYQAPMSVIFNAYNQSSDLLVQRAYTVDICIPNQYLKVKDKNYAYGCLIQGIARPHTICPLESYNKDHCKCDYSSRTKLALATSILTSFTLGIMLFLSHVIAFVKIDYILRWLIPLCFSLLASTVLFIIITLGATGSKLHEDVNELIYSTSLLKDAIQNETLHDVVENLVHTQNRYVYKVKFGWCFGLEILALHFTLVSIVLYALMFTAKRRPESSASS